MTEQTDPLTGLYCPHCDYALTGLPEHRCPECGNAFDPARLLAALAPESRPVQPWAGRHEIGFVRAFATTWWMVITRPHDFATGFPATPPAADVRSFAWICRILTATILAAALLFWATPAVIAVVIFALAVPAVAVTSFVVELIVADSCAHGGPLRTDRAPLTVEGWRGLIAFGSAFLPLSGIAAAAAVGTAGTGPWTILDPPLLPALFPLGACWWIHVGALAFARSSGRGCWWAVLTGVPVAIIVAVIVVAPVVMVLGVAVLSVVGAFFGF